MTEDDALRILDLQTGCTPAQVREAYLDLVKVWHPDRFQSDGRLRTKAEGILQELNDAYNTLQRPSGQREIASSTPTQRPEGPQTADVQSATAASLRSSPIATPTPARLVRDLGVAIAIGGGFAAILTIAVLWRTGAAIATPEPGSTDAGTIVPSVAVAEPLDELPARPASGTDLIAAARTGAGTLIVHNDGADDVVVVLAQGSDQARAIYVRAGERLTVPNIAPGRYRALMMRGRDWSTDHFTTDVSYDALPEPIEFQQQDRGNETEYTRLTISVGDGPGRNATGLLSTPPFRLSVH
jgi:hypothetical protein